MAMLMLLQDFIKKYGDAKIRFSYFAKSVVYFNGTGIDGENLIIAIDLIERGAFGLEFSTEEILVSEIEKRISFATIRYEDKTVHVR
jgi:hypothetical protein